MTSESGVSLNSIWVGAAEGRPDALFGRAAAGHDAGALTSSSLTTGRRRASIVDLQVVDQPATVGHAAGTRGGPLGLRGII